VTTLQRVISASEVSINGSFFKLLRPVQTVLSSQYPTKVLQGDITGDSQQRLSATRWSDARGGIGTKDQEGGDVTRIWYGTSHLRVQGHRTLPDLVTTTALSGVTGVFTVGAMAEFSDEIYVTFSTSVKKLDFGADSWGSSLHTLPGFATDALTVRLGGTVYMVFAHTGGMTYTTDGSSFTDITDDALHIADWDDRLWAIDNTGQLRWAFDPTDTWTDDAQLPLENANVRDLFVARDASDEEILYASTRVGLFAHDAANNRFVKTRMTLPFHADSGQGVVVWREATYIPAGLAIYKYNIGGSGGVITTEGPDKKQGLPADRRGKIVRLESTHNDLVLLIDDTSAGAEAFDAFVSSGMASHGSQVIDTATGRSLILGFDETGYQVLWESGPNEQAMDYSLVSNAYGGYRLWFAQNESIHYMALPVDVVNPSEISDRVYAASSRDEFPWFDAGQAEVDKLAVRLRVEVAEMSTNETVTVYYALDYNDSESAWVALTTLTTNGIHTFTLPNTTAGVITNATGLEFEAIRFRTDLARGSVNTLSPDVRSMTLEYRKKLPPRFGWSFDIDHNYEYKGQTPKQQRENLETAIKSNPRVEMTFRDDRGDTRNEYVDIAQFQSSERTGHDEKGSSRLVVLEL
jgi:hypothetical protein